MTTECALSKVLHTGAKLVGTMENHMNDQMRGWWNSGISKYWNLPEGYSSVAVLLVKWQDDLDDLKTAAEAQELENVFRDKFHFHTNTVNLNAQRKPQHQLNNHINKFIHDHDGPHSLLIVYYTGHGFYHEEKGYLELTANTNRKASCIWNKAEDCLRSEDVDGDVFTILDTCYASNLVKSGQRETRKFEMLSAAPIDQVTGIPGPYSFSRALIDALYDLLKEFGDRPFSTFHLNQRILLDKRRTDTPSHLWNRRTSDLHHNEQHIMLAPLKLAKAINSQMSESKMPPTSFLTLRFGLRDSDLRQEQIEFMTKSLSKAFNNKAMVGLRKIDWVGITPAQPVTPTTEVESPKVLRPITYFERVVLVKRCVQKWKNAIAVPKAQREAGSAVLSRSQKAHLSSQASQKRHLEDSGSPSVVKRRYLEVVPPLSPPVSDSSRVDEES